METAQAAAPEANSPGTSALDNVGAEDVCVLYQNNPNPFSESTVIRYTLDSNTYKADLYIYDLTGAQKLSFRLTGTGEGSVTVEGSALPAGMYIYALVVDGKVTDTKRMILTK